MKCLSVKQPWASLIASGRKTVELRSWDTRYRGPIIICASARPHLGTSHALGPLGVTTCLVNLVDVRPCQPGDSHLWEPGPRDLAWVLELVRPLPPVPVSGRLSLWAPSAELLAELGLE